VLLGKVLVLFYVEKQRSASALRDRQCSLSLSASRAASYVRMRTTAKHHAAGTVKRTVPYQEFFYFFHKLGDG
jgi:hypothetical protein